MSRLVRPFAAAVLLAACASAPARPPEAAAPPATRPSPATAAAVSSGFETARLAGTEQVVAGPFVLTWLSPGAELEVVSTAPGGGALGRVAGPLATPLHVAAGTGFRLAAAGEALYSGWRPAPLTRALDAWLGRSILVSVGGSVAASGPEPWTLRAIAADHLTVERSRTYRIVPVQRIVEITWTELTGIDPTPRIVVSSE